MRESLREKSVGLPSNLYAGFEFLHELPLQDKLEALQDQNELLEKELEQLKTGLATKEQFVNLDNIAKLQFENMFAHY